MVCAGEPTKVSKPVATKTANDAKTGNVAANATNDAGCDLIDDDDDESAEKLIEENRQLKESRLCRVINIFIVFLQFSGSMQ